MAFVLLLLRGNAGSSTVVIAVIDYNLKYCVYHYESLNLGTFTNINKTISLIQSAFIHA